ncbi:NADPH-dependent FMN reductase [Flavobacterium sp. CS20]|jgi:NAD(P)H-dependent FMN reductase|uniref:NADPH-dependent FMN reductase n=1 Tax=Flavobacterium sp. CS20 TaxID=2775246 RepID=UPI001B3A64C1|nr:NAD(P)H-dependent oxidoreductase [Flavobacterium sp. CS20]QTY28063.1 NAD(P)H-dependent oxidoreductase [Flavobacterium sp. CS20]
MKNILAFAGSNSSTSINFKLVSYVASQISDHKVELIDLKDFDIPMYSADVEEKQGFPKSIKKLNKHIQNADALLISVNEHNGGLSAFFKNCIDWLSRHDRDFLKNKKVFIISTSSGRGGAKMANDYTVDILPRFGAEVVSNFALTSFNHSFSEEEGITDKAQNEEFKKALNTFIKEID